VWLQIKQIAGNADEIKPLALLREPLKPTVVRVKISAVE
jgi:hypothetical protein